MSTRKLFKFLLLVWYLLINKAESCSKKVPHFCILVAVINLSSAIEKSTSSFLSLLLLLYSSSKSVGPLLIDSTFYNLGLYFPSGLPIIF